MNRFKNSDKILIIGGTGFIGRHLAERCMRDTPHITSLGFTDKSACGTVTGKVELIHADISSKSQLKSVLSGKQFDYVFNLAGYIDHTHYFNGGRKIIETHFIGLMNLIDSLDIETLKGFVQIGSSDEYGDSPAPQKETMSMKPISPYSMAKTAASYFIEMLSNTEKFPGVVLRLFLVYGPGQNSKRFLPQLINACLKGDEFKISEGKQIRDFCFVEDVVEALVKAALSQKAKGHIINVASGTPLTIREVTEKVVLLAGGGKPLWGLYPYRKGENMQLYGDISLANDLLEWYPLINFDEGLKRTIDYYRNSLSGGNR